MNPRLVKWEEDEQNRMEHKVWNLCFPSETSTADPLAVEAWFSFMRVLKIPTNPAIAIMTEVAQKASWKSIKSRWAALENSLGVTRLVTPAISPSLRFR